MIPDSVWFVVVVVLFLWGTWRFSGRSKRGDVLPPAMPDMTEEQKRIVRRTRALEYEQRHGKTGY